jgi:hypothetical protein
MSTPDKYADATLGNVVGETMQHVINQAEDEFNTATGDLQYARDSLKMLLRAEEEIRQAIVDSGLDKSHTTRSMKP